MKGRTCNYNLAGPHWTRVRFTWKLPLHSVNVPVMGCSAGDSFQMSIKLSSIYSWFGSVICILPRFWWNWKHRIFSSLPSLSVEQTALPKCHVSAYQHSKESIFQSASESLPDANLSIVKGGLWQILMAFEKLSLHQCSRCSFTQANSFV